MRLEGLPPAVMYLRTVSQQRGSSTKSGRRLLQAVELTVPPPWIIGIIPLDRRGIKAPPQ